MAIANLRLRNTGTDQEHAPQRLKPRRIGTYIAMLKRCATQKLTFELRSGSQINARGPDISLMSESHGTGLTGVVGFGRPAARGNVAIEQSRADQRRCQDPDSLPDGV
jgi:hypothetical protein